MSPSAKCVICQPQGRKSSVAKMGNNQRYNSVGCRFQSRNPTARSQEQRGRMAACRTQTRTLNSTTHQTQGRKVGRDDGCRKVGCSQGWQGGNRKVARSDWVFATSANQSQESLAKAGSQPTFVAVVRLQQHPHEEQSSFGRHRGVYHGATTGITTLIRSLRVLLSSRSERHHYAPSVAPVATHSPLREYSFSPSVAPVATHSPLRECISPLLHTLRFPFLLRALRPPSLLRSVLASLAFSPSCRPGNCSYVATCQACI